MKQFFFHLSAFQRKIFSLPPKPCSNQIRRSNEKIIQANCIVDESCKMYVFWHLVGTQYSWSTFCFCWIGFPKFINKMQFVVSTSRSIHTHTSKINSLQTLRQLMCIFLVISLSLRCRYNIFNYTSIYNHSQPRWKLCILLYSINLFVAVCWNI